MRLVMLALASILLAIAPAAAAMLPSPTELEAVLGTPQAVDVVEPHLARGNERPRVRYVGWPIDAVLAHLFGTDWARTSQDLEFRALDGFVAHVPLERFTKHRGYLVHQRADGATFTIDVPAQNEKDVPLAPYYLVWDNIAEPGLQAEGPAFWPYQVATILSGADTRAALLPGELATRFAAEAELASKLCLTCHKLNGYGGEKMPIDLGQRAKEMGAAEFERWVLEPAKVRPGTTMPALQPNLAPDERRALAQRLHRYLVAIPAIAAR